MVTKKSAKGAANPYLGDGDIDALSPANRLAYEIIADRRDVLPSVERIMNAGLAEPDTVNALTLFRTALGSLDDPNRDPRAAVAAATAASSGS
ncbi:hypothetical protein [Desertimonas flava]|uniref:hypothetical protein n=1 Tax=Desertimonas flava TaxID=2064846 RepID=UPI000E34C8BA|nr:hypothetical protein [Desertimonas flava]